MIIRKHPIIKVQKNRTQKQAESIIQDKTVSISVDDSTTLLHTIHGNERALVLGFLATHFSIYSLNDVQSIHESSDHYVVKLHSSISPRSFHSDRSIKLSFIDIYTLTAQFQEKALLFKDTGMCESVALCTPSSMLYHAEDLTGQTALLKVLGLQLKEGSSPAPVLLTSATISTQLVEYSSQHFIECIISRVSATKSSIDLAESHDITLLSYARGQKFSILTHPQRIHCP